MKKNYKIYIDEIDYSSYLQLPLSITKKIDETYDTATVILNFTDKNRPFKKNSLVKIDIYTNNLNDGETYYFYINDDIVEESIKKENIIYYKHTLFLIETTKKADNIFIPGWSVTNHSDAEIIGNDYSTWKGSNVFVDFNPPLNGAEYGGNIWWYTHLSQIKALSSRFRQKIFLNERMNMNYTKGSDILLPSLSVEINPIDGYYINPNASGNYINGYQESNTILSWTDWPVLNFQYNLELPCFIRYSIKEENALTYTPIGITKMYQGKQTVIKSYNYNFSIAENNKAFFNMGEELGSYDIRIQAVQYNREYDIDDILFTNLDTLSNGEITSTILDRLDQYSSIFTYSNNSFRTTFSVQEAVTPKTTFKTLDFILNKIVNMIPEEYGKFTIDEAFLARVDAANTPIPDLVFGGVKNLSEILFEIGKVVRSVPIISHNNVISFESYLPEDNENFDTLNELTNKLTGDNYSSGLVSDLKNIINISDKAQTIYSYYPAKGKFVKCRAADSYSAIVNPDNLAIIIENAKQGIYAIKEVKVKNFWNGGSSYTEDPLGLDITAFVLEKNDYDSLYINCKDKNGNIITNNTTQANTVYYEKNKNKIQLSFISDDQAISIFGSVSSATYQIQNAIAAALFNKFDSDIAGIKTTSGTGRSYSTLKSPENYLFQIKYIETFNSLIKTEQFNQYDFKDDAYDLNYNQESQDISAFTFGINAQEEVSRRGNLNLQTSKTVYSLLNLPKMGELKLLENEYYLADEITYNYDFNYVKCDINFTKDYRKISRLVNVMRQYRNYNIEATPVVDRNINFSKYINIKLGENGDENLIKYSDIIPVQLENVLFNRRQRFPYYAVLYFKDEDLNLVKYLDFNASTPTVKVYKSIHPIIVPITPSLHGNSVSFSFSMMDNFAAGTYLDGSTGSFKDLMGSVYTTGLTQSWARYVDEYGEAHSVSIYIIKAENNSILDNYLTYFPYAYTTGGNDIPEANAFEASLFSFINKPIYKDSGEKISFILQLHYITKEKSINWNQSFIKYLLWQDDGTLGRQIYQDQYGLTNVKYKPVFYGLNKDEFNNETVIYNDDNIFSIASKDDNDKTDTIDGFTIIPNKSYYGYGLVLPKTNEILFNIKRFLKEGESIDLPKIGFKQGRN